MVDVSVVHVVRPRPQIEAIAFELQSNGFLGKAGLHSESHGGEALVEICRDGLVRCFFRYVGGHDFKLVSLTEKVLLLFCVVAQEALQEIADLIFLFHCFCNKITDTRISVCS